MDVTANDETGHGTDAMRREFEELATAMVDAGARWDKVASALCGAFIPWLYENCPPAIFADIANTSIGSQRLLTRELVKIAAKEAEAIP